MGFPRPEYWSGLPFPSPGDLFDPGIEPASPALADGFFTAELPGKPSHGLCCSCSVAQLCLTLCMPGFPVLHYLPELGQTSCDPMDYSPPGSSVHGVFQARMLEWVAISSSRGSSRTRDRTWVSCTGQWIHYHWTTREAQSCVWGSLKDK